MSTATRAFLWCLQVNFIHIDPAGNDRFSLYRQADSRGEQRVQVNMLNFSFHTHSIGQRKSRGNGKSLKN